GTEGTLPARPLPGDSVAELRRDSQGAPRQASAVPKVGAMCWSSKEVPMSTTPENEPTPQGAPQPTVSAPQPTVSFAAAYPPPPAPPPAPSVPPAGLSDPSQTPGRPAGTKRAPWIPVVGAAVAGALVASLATLGVTGALTARTTTAQEQTTPADLSTIG